MSQKKVLSLYKRLNKIVKEVFDGDNRAIIEAKMKIKDEFKKNKELQTDEEIKQKIKIGEDVGRIMETQLVQLVKKKSEVNSYELKIRDSTAKLDNVIFKEDIVLPPLRSKKCKDPSSS